MDPADSSYVAPRVVVAIFCGSVGNIPIKSNKPLKTPRLQFVRFRKRVLIKYDWVHGIIAKPAAGQGVGFRLRCLSIADVMYRGPVLKRLREVGGMFKRLRFIDSSIHPGLFR